MMHPVMKNLFEPVEHTHFEWCVLETKESVEELFATGEYQETEERILNALFDYRYLNRYNLTRLVGRGDIKKHLDKMLSQGIIGEYVLTDHAGNRQENTLIVYQLSKKADSYLLEGKKRERGYRRNNAPSEDEIYKTLSMNQYHIGMVLENKDKILSHSVHFCDTYREMGTVHIPSLIVLKNGLSLIGLPMARRDEDFTAQIRTLLKLAGYLKEKELEHRFPFIIWVASSNRALIEGMEKVRRIKELQNIPVAYILDYNTRSGNPIHQIYTAKQKGENRTELGRVML